jgi:hypothetical protein
MTGASVLGVGLGVGGFIVAANLIGLVGLVWFILRKTEA